MSLTPSFHHHGQIVATISTPRMPGSKKLKKILSNSKCFHDSRDCDWLIRPITILPGSPNGWCALQNSPSGLPSNWPSNGKGKLKNSLMRGGRLLPSWHRWWPWVCCVAAPVLVVLNHGCMARTMRPQSHNSNCS